MRSSVGMEISISLSLPLFRALESDSFASARACGIYRRDVCARAGYCLFKRNKYILSPF